MAQIVAPRVDWRSYTNERSSEYITEVASGESLSSSLIAYGQGTSSSNSVTQGYPV